MRGKNFDGDGAIETDVADAIHSSVSPLPYSEVAAYSIAIFASGRMTRRKSIVARHSALSVR